MPRKSDLITIILNEDWWEAETRTREILSQKFATVLSDEDLSNADAHERNGFTMRPRLPASIKASGSSKVKIDEDGFQVTLDLDDFEFEDLGVKTYERYVEVHGKHEEKSDKHGLVSREFCRRYMVPFNCDIESLASSFSTDRKLTIKAPASQKRFLNLPRKLTVFKSELKKDSLEEWLDVSMMLRDYLESHDIEYFDKVIKEVQNTRKRMRVADVTPQPLDEPVADVTPKPLDEPVADVTPKPLDEPVADVTPKPLDEPVADVTPKL